MLINFFVFFFFLVDDDLLLELVGNAIIEAQNNLRDPFFRYSNQSFNKK